MLKVTTWVQHFIYSHPFNSMSIGHPIPEIRLFQNLTLQIQGQGHGWGECGESLHGSNILLTHISLVSCQSAILFLRYDFFKIWPWKSKVKVMDEVNLERQNMGPTLYRPTSLSFHVNQPSHSWDTTFQNLTLKIQGQGHGWQITNPANRVIRGFYCTVWQHVMLELSWKFCESASIWPYNMMPCYSHHTIFVNL